jgi:hypothetical protein
VKLCVVLFLVALAGPIAGCGGHPPSPVLAVISPGQMVLDAHDVVLTAVTDALQGGALIRAQPGSGTFTVLAGGTRDESLDAALAADGQRFYFPVRNPAGFASSINSLPRVGGVLSKLVDTPGEIMGIAIDATQVYWIEGSAAAGFVKAAPLTGGTATVLAQDQPVTGGIAVDASSVYFTIDPGLPDGPSGSVLSVPTTGGAPRTLAAAQNSPASVFTDGVSLFWLNRGTRGTDCSATDGAVMKLDLATGTLIALAENIAGVSDLALGNGEVFFSARGAYCDVQTTPSGTVTKVPTSAGSPATLAIGQPDPGVLVVDGSALYYTTVVDDFGHVALVTVTD